MTEIYWLQRLGNIACVLDVGFWGCAILTGVCAVICFCGWMDDNFDDNDRKRAARWFKKSAMIFCFFAIGWIFIPSKKELVVIYGLGTTIDYIKSNDKAKQLPDKVVDALTRYVDSIEKENTNN